MTQEQQCCMGGMELNTLVLVTIETLGRNYGTSHLAFFPREQTPQKVLLHCLSTVYQTERTATGYLAFISDETLHRPWPHSDSGISLTLRGKETPRAITK